jgi:hypothetical protein
MQTWPPGAVAAKSRQTSADLADPGCLHRQLVIGIVPTVTPLMIRMAEPLKMGANASGQFAPVTVKFVAAAPHRD